MRNPFWRLKAIYFSWFPCRAEGEPWYKWRRKHYWGGLRNKRGVFYRRVCKHCETYQNRKHGKWVGYIGMKFDTSKAEFPPVKSKKGLLNRIF
jgi:hypothetical protein